VQCIFHDTHVLDLGETAMLTVGNDCYDCGPCTDTGMTCRQIFGFVS